MVQHQYCGNIPMKSKLLKSGFIAAGLLWSFSAVKGQVTLIKDYQNNFSPQIGNFQGINYRESGFSGLYAIPGTNGTEFWTVTDRGVNIDAANANLPGCRPTYDKMYAFPNYAPKIVRIRLQGDSIQILEVISIKRPNGMGATGLINPTGLGSTAAEVPSTDTVMGCSRFGLKTVAKDTWGIDAEGIVVDKDGNFWICEEGGPTIWKLDPNGVVLKRYTPYAHLQGKQSQDVQIDSCFKYRKNKRGFEGIALAPNGKIYAFIQSPLLFPTTNVGEGTRIHRILEIDPVTNTNRMFVYLNDGIFGSSGGNQIRLRDWKLGDAVAINNNEFLVLEAAARGTSDIKRLYKVDISNATPVSSALYGGKTLEAWVDSIGIAAFGIKAVKKSLVMDLLSTGWPSSLDKAEGISILNDSTIAICNDNDYGQSSPNADGLAIASGKLSHLVTFKLSGSAKLTGYVPYQVSVNTGKTGPSSSRRPYLRSLTTGAMFTSIITAGDQANSYTCAGTPDGSGAIDNGDGTFTLFVNHEFGNTAGVARTHGQKGSFISQWVIDKSDLSVVSGADVIKTVHLWSAGNYVLGSGSSIAFNRFCSGNLPEATAFYNPISGLGTTERIFMNGEESGPEGRAFAHVLTGANAGNSWELPRMGKFSMENALASPAISDKTIVIGTDDATPGQIYVYIGTKTSTGSEIEKAGLTNGKLYGVAVNGLSAESSGSIPAANTPFALVDLGNVEDSTGAKLNGLSNAKSVTNFLRPEDGSWDPTNLSDFYFVTTNAFSSPSRMWRLRFADILNPEMGGTATAVLDGTEGQKMMDNLTIDYSGNAYVQEDVGNNAHNGKIWKYNFKSDQLSLIADHDPSRFIAGGANYLTQDEESSGIFDAQAILGPGMFMLVDQAHYSQAGEIVEGGQILAYYNPETAADLAEIAVTGNGVGIINAKNGISTSDNTDFGRVGVNYSQIKSFVVKNSGTGDLVIGQVRFSGGTSSEFEWSNPLPLPYHLPAGESLTLFVKLQPTSVGVKNTALVIANSDYDETQYYFTIGGTAIAGGVQGPSSSSAPYLVPAAPGVTFTSILTAGDKIGGYTACGTMDGLGAYDNGNGTFSLVMHHEFGSTSGAARAHGEKGSFVSKWVINKSNLTVISGKDLIKTVKLWNGTGYDTYTSANSNSNLAFNRFCSADLPMPTAFYNSKTGLGTKERIYLGGEESGSEGRAFGHIITGPNEGTSYQLPYLGRFSWENAVANPNENDKTIVAGTDDATPGQVYFYIGTKKTTGTEIEKAGLTGGKLYGVAVTGLSTEVNGSIPADNTAFTLVDLGDVSALTGADLNTQSNNKGVTTFLRPEDGSWDPANPRDFYFATTNAFSSPSRLWRLRFNDAANPEKGGSISALLDGTEGPKMMDNLTVDNYGHVIIQEDPGNNAHIAKIWQYDIATDKITQIGEHDATRFLAGGSNYLTQDEESSGVIDVQSILGPGMFLLVDQAHYSIPGEVVEGGQLLAMYNPETFNANPEIVLTGNSVEISSGNATPIAENNTHYGTVVKGNEIVKSYTISNRGFGPLRIAGFSMQGLNPMDFEFVSLPPLPVVLAAGKSVTFTARFIPSSAGSKTAVIKVMSNDFDEGEFQIAIAGVGIEPATGVVNPNTSFGRVSLYPNPTSADATLALNMIYGETVRVQLINMMGEVVLSPIQVSNFDGEKHIELPTSNLPGGIYFVEIQKGDAVNLIKLVVE